MTLDKRIKHQAKLVFMASIMSFVGATAHAEIDGHGPDAWRGNGVSSNDTLNVRMGPGTSYPVIERFAHNERNLEQITCVPFYNAGHYSALTQAQIAALPQRWCLMRTAGMDKAGWVAQRFITPDQSGEGQAQSQSFSAPQGNALQSDQVGLDHVVEGARNLVEELYYHQIETDASGGPGPLDPVNANMYFTDDIVAWLNSGNVQAHPLFGAQDFDGTVQSPTPDPDQPMFRGMVTINVDFTNFGQQQRAVFHLRADTTKPGAPLRIFNVEHDGWSYP
ncbi:SH3 domain-containing protein [Yoonia sp. MH D7]